MDFYEILEIDRDASPSEIRSAYRRLARSNHPDSSEQQDSSRFRKIHEAYETLSDSEKKRSYDGLLGTSVPVRIVESSNPIREVNFAEQRNWTVREVRRGLEEDFNTTFEDLDRFLSHLIRELF
jgi:DnaJ-class molecular chaperone